jgi:hypothetical protein
MSSERLPGDEYGDARPRRNVEVAANAYAGFVLSV